MADRSEETGAAVFNPDEVDRKLLEEEEGGAPPVAEQEIPAYVVPPAVESGGFPSQAPWPPASGVTYPAGPMQRGEARVAVVAALHTVAIFAHQVEGLAGRLAPNTRERTVVENASREIGRAYNSLAAVAGLLAPALGG